MQRTCFNGNKYKSECASRYCVGALDVHMNDIGSAIKECEYYLFVDNTLLSVSGTSVQREIEKFMEKLNCDLQNLSKWLKFNKLKLNVSKTKY
jgi:hypothetical protein